MMEDRAETMEREAAPGGVSAEIQERVRKLIEQLAAQKRPAFTLTEQLAWLIYIRKKRPDADLPLFDLSVFGAVGEESPEDILEELKQEPDAPDFLRGARLLPDRQLLYGIWELVSMLLRENPSLSLEEGMRPAGVFDCVLEQMGRKCRDVFLTPAPLVRTVCQMLDFKKAQTLWDPACGTGSFLAEAWRQNRSGGALRYLCGTDLSASMIRAARIGLYYNSVPGRTAMLKQGSAFEGEEKRFDVIVCNPPVVSSVPADRGFYRPKIPTRRVNLLFLQLIMDSLREDGQAAVFINENVLFSDQAAESAIRKRLVEKKGLRAVISLPQGAFAPATGAKMSVLFFGGGPEEAVFFYELGAIGYSLNGKRTPVPENDLPDLLEKWKDRKRLLRTWQKACRGPLRINEYHVQVPQGWKYERCFFASQETIRGTGYNLTSRMYRGTADLEEAYASPEQIIGKLSGLEYETKNKLKELMEMMRDYE